jgi:hypothetical protein
LSDPRRRARITVAIRRPDDDAILVRRDRTLPVFELEDPGEWQMVSPVNEAVRGRFGLTVTTLRACWSSADAGERLYEAVWLAGATPAGSSWVAAGDLRTERVATSPTVTAAVADGVLEPATGDRQPWYVPGWLDGMTRWIDERLVDAGLRRHGEIRQVRSWGRSALFQARTDRGLVWAKEVPMTFAHEIAVTGLLADVDPGLVPPLIAVDPAAGRLLMSHVEGPSLTEVADPAAWTATLARLGETQRVISVERERLLIAGVASAPLATLAEEVPALLADRALLRGDDDGIDDELVMRLAAAQEDLADRCRRLAASGFPDSLDHGDFSASQVILGEMGPVIFDWSDASITHPLLSLAAFLGDDADHPDGIRGSVVEAYLGPWSGTTDRVAALEASRLASIVLPLHLARLFRDRVLPGLEQPWEMARVVPDAMRRLDADLTREAAGR